MQIRVQHPNQPSTRLAIKVPRLGIHFSPARYHRLMSVLSAIGGADNVSGGSSETGVAVPWQRSDFLGDARILVWGVSSAVLLSLTGWRHVHLSRQFMIDAYIADVVMTFSLHSVNYCRV